MQMITEQMIDAAVVRISRTSKKTLCRACGHMMRTIVTVRGLRNESVKYAICTPCSKDPQKALSAYHTDRTYTSGGICLNCGRDWENGGQDCDNPVLF
jgi:hypothetical protein